MHEIRRKCYLSNNFFTEGGNCFLFVSCEQVCNYIAFCVMHAPNYIPCGRASVIHFDISKMPHQVNVVHDSMFHPNHGLQHFNTPLFHFWVNQLQAERKQTSAYVFWNVYVLSACWQNGHIVYPKSYGIYLGVPAPARPNPKCV